MSKRVVMLVFSPLEHDARVHREAASLATHGYDVAVYGLHRIRGTSGAHHLDYRTRSWRAGPRRHGPARRLRGILARFAVGFRMIACGWRDRPNFVHAHDVDTLPFAWLLARLLRARLVYDAHEISIARQGMERWRFVIACLERALVRRADRVITTTATRARFLARVYGIERPTVLQNRPATFTPAPTNLIREHLGLSTDRTIVLYQGGLQPGRGLFRLLRSAQDCETAVFVLLGDGSLRAALLDQIRKARLESSVYLLPAVPHSELPEWTASADIGVQPLENTCFNHWSTDSNKIFEYAVAGLPVIASNFPEIRSVVHQFGIGFTFATDQELTARLKRLLADNHLRHELSKNARAARAALSWKSQEPALLSLYQELGPGEKSVP